MEIGPSTNVFQVNVIKLAKNLIVNLKRNDSCKDEKHMMRLHFLLTVKRIKSEPAEETQLKHILPGFGGLRK